MANTIQQIITGQGGAGGLGITTTDIDITSFGGDPLTDLSKAFLIMDYDTGSLNSQHANRFWNYEILDTTTIRLNHDPTGASNLSSNYGFRLIEFDIYSDIEVQHKSLTITDANGTGGSAFTSDDQTITAVDTSTTMIIAGGHNHDGSDSSTGSEECYITKLKSSTAWTINLEVFFNDTATEIHKAQIVDWGSGVTVQSGSHTMLSGISYDIITPSTAVDPTRTMLLVNHSHDTTLSTGTYYQIGFSATLNANGDIELFRFAGGSENHEVYWQLIEFDADVANVQHNLFRVSDDVEDESFGITPVDIGNSFAMGTTCLYNGYGWGIHQSSGATHYGAMNGRIELTEPYLVTILGSNSTDFLDIGTQVIEFAPAISSSSSSSAQGVMAPITGVTKIFVATSGGNDANDGGDLLGLDVQFATWTASTKRITQTGAFSSYTFTAGDKIYLSHASITDDRYEIASKISSNIIDLVDSIFGSDLADVQSSNGPLETITFTESIIAAGNQIFLCTMADGEKFDSDSFPIVLNTAGASGAYIAWYGADSQGTIGTVAVVDAGGAGNVIEVASVADRNSFFYIRAQNGGNNGWSLSGSSYGRYFRCEGFNNNVDGFSVSSNNISMVECHADNNSTHGFHVSLFDQHSIGCIASNNGQRGFNNGFADTGGNRERGERCSQIFSVAYNNPGVTTQDIGFRRPRFMANCVAHNNNDDGISFFGELFRRNPVIINCIVTDNAAYGIDDEGMPLILLNNGFANNGTGETRNAPLYEQGRIDLEDTPFQSVADDNFTLDRGSRSGLLAQTRGTSVVAFKKPANIIQNGGFDSETNWLVQGNWSIANGVAHHATGGASGLNYTPTIVTDNVLYETIYTISNYVSGSVKIQVGTVASGGTLRSANGIYREIILGVSPSEETISFVPTPSDFEADIDNVFIAPLHSGPGTGTKFSTQSHLGAAFPKDRLIKVQ